MKYSNPRHIGKYVASACLIWSMATTTLAGSFTPEEGSTIVTNPVKVEWSSDAPQQWVRAYANGVKIYDSYRQKSPSGSVQFSVNPDISALTVFFYERPSNGQWIATERRYGVSIINDRVNSLADLPCEPDQIAVADGAGNWNCAAQGIPDVEAITDAVDSRFCNEGEELTRTNEGLIACQFSCPYSEQLRAVGATRLSDKARVFGGVGYECTVVTNRGSNTFQTLIWNKTDNTVGLRMSEDSGSGSTLLLNATLDNPDDQLYCARLMGCDEFDPSSGPSDFQYD